MTIHKLDGQKEHCPGCGRSCHGVSNLQAARRPRPGEPLICDRCSCIHTVDGDGHLVGLTDAQITELGLYFLDNPDQFAMLLSVVHVIRYARASVN